MIKRIIITGGPCSGKTSIIDSLKDKGYKCFNEISREIIQKMNIKTSYKKIDFEETVFKKRKRDFLNAKIGINFYDRSMLDNLAYLKINNHEIPTKFKIDCENYRYHPTVFITTPWEDIYTVDDERLESFKDSIQIFEALKEVYIEASYNLVELPQSSVKERIRFIINEI